MEFQYVIRGVQPGKEGLALVIEPTLNFRDGDVFDINELVYLSKTARQEIKESPGTPTNTAMDAIVRAARNVDSHWREFGPEHGFGEVMDHLYAVLQQQHQ